MADRHTTKAYSLRVSEPIMSEIRTIAEEESRSLNMQIEHILSMYLKERREYKNSLEPYKL